MKLIFENWRSFSEPIEEIKVKTYEDEEQNIRQLSFDNLIETVQMLARGSTITLQNEKINREMIYSQDQESNRELPKGLWFAKGATWLKFVKTQMPDIADDAKYLYSITYNIPKVINIKNEQEAYKLLYKMDILLPEEQKDLWRNVATKFDGVVFTGYNKNEMPQNVPSPESIAWYYGVDFDSGCIWNLRAIKNFKLIAEKKEDGWEFYT